MSEVLKNGVDQIIPVPADVFDHILITSDFPDTRVLYSAPDI